MSVLEPVNSEKPVSESSTQNPSEILRQDDLQDTSQCPAVSLDQVVEGQISDAVGSPNVVGSPSEKTFPASPSVLPAQRKRLKLTQQRFIEALTTPNQPAFGNGTEAYAQAHPTCTTRGSAEVGAVRTLGNARVKEELEALGWGKGRLEWELKRNMNACWESKKLADHREAVKVYAQLTGEWKERQEITQIDSQEKDIIRRLVSETITSQ